VIKPLSSRFRNKLMGCNKEVFCDLGSQKRLK
jgi:hypothetical protein